ncbi:AAA family ATPase [Hymenobacter cheonanensis]|uniref:AAA family ATPase n=1 Tax=Hymenobacter sp. CA2-7 TaxID=3063993 RepID=UPI002713980F|nr:AAA family ATPase [Hymenobacter sp. CA2-7]MDO7887202.1 AAA family ATPase [Hymenobacter sp. CA2-7]
MSNALGLVVGKFWPPHRGHQLLLETAAAQVAELLVLVYAHPDDAAHPAPARAAWLRELYRGDDFAPGPRVGATPLRIIALTAEADGLPPDAADDHTHRAFVRQWLASHGYRPSVVFSSEAYGPGLAEHLGAAHVLVDAERRQVPVSGTALKLELGMWGEKSAGNNSSAFILNSKLNFLHPFVAAQYGAVPPAAGPRLVLLGAESSGKTTLATALAEALGTAWVPEYGRLLHEQKNGALDYEDLLYIGRRQLELEDEAAPRASGWLVCDTNAATTALYSYYYFHRCDPALLALARVCGQRYARTFVCMPTVPFEQDGWRGPEALRQFQHGAILMQLEALGIPYTLLDGSVAERVAQVRAAL